MVFGRKTLALIKPDGYQNSGKILGVIANSGFSIVAQKEMRWNPEQAARFYRQHVGRHFFSVLIEHMSSGPLIALVLEHDRNTVGHWRNLMGETDPSKAAEGTIRKMFAKSGDPIYKNVVHGSDSPAAAKREIMMVFSSLELTGK